MGELCDPPCPPHFHSPLSLLCLSSIPHIQVPLYNSCPGAAPAFFGTGLEREKKRQMFNFHFLCASLYLSVCLCVPPVLALFAINAESLLVLCTVEQLNRMQSIQVTISRHAKNRHQNNWVCRLHLEAVRLKYET